MKTADVVRALLASGRTVATAESLTGGLLGAAICDVPGASGCFLGGMLTYRDEIKARLLGVPWEILQTYTAVSAPCAGAMAEGARKALGADYALSTTGYAGPTGEKVGLVYVGVSGPRGTHTYELHFSGTRAGIRAMTVRAALCVLWKEMEPNGEENRGEKGGL